MNRIFLVDLIGESDESDDEDYQDVEENSDYNDDDDDDDDDESDVTDDLLEGLPKFIRDGRKKDFSLDALHRQANTEEVRMIELRQFRKSSPLFVEDHDYLYRLIAYNGGQFVAKSDAANFLIGPVDESPAASLKLHLIENDGSNQPAVADTLREDYTCCICLNLMFDPTTLPCGHSGCLKCMKAALIHTSGQNRGKCPMCKSDVLLDPKREMEVSLTLRSTMMQLFPHEYGKRDNEPIEIALNTICHALNKQFGTVTTTMNDNLDVDTPLRIEPKASNEASDRAIQSYTMFSQSLAYRILKDHTLLHYAHMTSTLTLRNQLHQQAATCSQLESITLESCSQLPYSFFQYLVSPVQCANRSYSHETQPYERFVSFLKALTNTSSSSSSFGCLPYGDDALKRYLPDHQLRQCYRRAGILFEEESTNNDAYHCTRKLVVKSLLNPLIQLLDVNTPDSSYLDVPELSVKVVLVDDVLRAIHYIGPTCTVPIGRVYGFGVPYVPKGLLGPSLLTLLRRVDADQRGINEIALSVVHDMLVTCSIDVLRSAQRYGKQLPVGITYCDRATSCLLRNDKVDISPLFGNIEGDNSHAAKRGRGSNGSILHQSKQGWKSSIYHQSHASETNGSSLGKKRESSSMHEDSCDDDVDVSNSSSDVFMITSADILRAIREKIVNDTVLNYAMQHIRAAQGKWRQYCSQHVPTTGLNVDSSLASLCGLTIAPQLVFYMMQFLPEFSHRGSISMTIDALIGLTALIEYLAEEILQISVYRCDKRSHEQCLSPRQIKLALDADNGMRSIFPGNIRNGGVTVSTVVPHMPDEDVHAVDLEDDGRVDEDYDKFMKSVRATVKGKVCIHPLTGTLCQLSATDSNQVHSTEEVVVLQALSRLTEASSEDGLPIDNLFRCKAHAIECLSTEDQEALESLTDSQLAMWKIRCREMTSAQHNWLPVFDKEAIHCLCCSLYASLKKSDVSLRLSVESCELISCMIENYIVEFVRNSRKSLAQTEDMMYILQAKDLSR